LDGLRGIAALSVVVHHFCCAFLSRYVTGVSDHPSWFVDTPLGIVVNGRFSVYIFFVLSGFVVSRAALKSNDPVYVNIPLRYLRLALPATASAILAWGLLTLMPNAATRSSDILSNSWLLHGYQNQIPNIFHALYEGLIGIFIHGDSGFNNALWTMRIEAIGSMVIYLLYGEKNALIRRELLIALGIVTLFMPCYFCFLLGALMMELWSMGKLKFGYPRTALLAGILLGFPGYGFVKRLHIPYVRHSRGALQVGESTSLIAPLAAALILYAVLNYEPLEKFLSSRIPRYLGRISFPLYLVHSPLLLTVFASVYVWINPASKIILLPLFAAFLGCSLIVANAGEAWIDKPVLDKISWTRKKLRSWRSSKNEPITANP